MKGAERNLAELSICWTVKVHNWKKAEKKGEKRKGALTEKGRKESGMILQNQVFDNLENTETDRIQTKEPYTQTNSRLNQRTICMHYPIWCMI
jgi:predicted transcriptional regulator